jgi:hypothetical protein
LDAILGRFDGERRKDKGEREKEKVKVERVRSLFFDI